jgi:oligosaccharide repeat unit polymerase
MDQMAVTLSQVDEREEFYYGSTYLSVLVLPIPRAFWPDKPGQADWQKELQTPGRPTGIIGAIATAYGEAYANFGGLGIIIYAVVLAWFLHRLHEWMLGSPYFSLANFWSLCVYSILIQVFRDGLLSFFTFQVTILMPLSLITFVHLVFLRRIYTYDGYFAGWWTMFEGSDAYLDGEGNTHYHSYEER